MILLPNSLDVGAIALVVGIIAEVTAIMLPRGFMRTLIAGLSLAATLFGSSLVAASYLWLGTILAFIVAIYRAINLIRAVDGRMHELYLRKVVRRSSLALIFMQALVYVVTWQWHAHYSDVHLLNLSKALLALSAIASLVLLVTTIVRLANSRYIKAASIAENDLPTVSLLIPARNESPELTECIAAALKSNYKKLEIIVLDDHSQDQTQELIKQFAHDGVRFIPGAKPQNTWLPKNLAYDQLSKEATGSLLFFIGADVRLSVESISLAVDYIAAKDLEMISVLPRRTGHGLIGTFIQPMRYWLEVAIPRFKRPPVLSTAWLIYKKSYQEQGGMKASTRNIVPETILARNLNSKRKYGFVQSVGGLGIETKKSIREQISTAIRTRYPQLHRRPENVLIFSCFEFFILLVPYIVLIAWFFSDYVRSHHTIILLAGISALCLSVSHVLTTLRSNPGVWPLALINFPTVVVIELILEQLSMIKYEFSTVTWKGRDIALPVMHVVPSLPPMRQRPRTR